MTFHLTSPDFTGLHRTSPEFIGLTAENKITKNIEFSKKHEKHTILLNLILFFPKSFDSEESIKNHGVFVFFFKNHEIATSVVCEDPFDSFLHKNSFFCIV